MPPKMSSSPARPDQRPCDIDDVVSSRRWVVLGPGDPEPDPEIDTSHLSELKIAVGQIERPFRAKPMPNPAETSDTSEKVSSR